MKKLIPILLAATIVISCSQAQKPKEKEDEATLRKEIAQMLVVGFRGTSIDDNNHIVRDIRDLGIGGVILFEYDAPSKSRPRNISGKEQLRTLCQQLQNLSDDKLLIGIDQEGGMVSRLKTKYGFPTFASAQKTAKDGDDSVRFYARLTASTLSQLGINLNFAPCVDVNINPDCPIIGKLERSFSSDPRRVAECANIWIDEQQKLGVMACLKHFPGHGSSLSDTHLGLADVSDTWQRKELEPYRSLIKDGNVRMIMTTHVFNAKLDSIFPATLSQRILTGLLRDSLHYDGLIITDDLAMGAMTQMYEYEEIIYRTIMAGADLLCISNNGKDYNPDIAPQTIDLIYNMVKSGKISADRIHESAARIRKTIKTL